MRYLRFWKVPLVVLIIACVTACTRRTDITSTFVYQVNSTIYSHIAWSPDSSRILAIGRRYPPSSVAHLYLINLDTGKSQKITENAEMFDYPNWSPDGSMAVVTVDLDSIWLLDFNNTRISSLVKGEGAVWLPNGKGIAVYDGFISNPGTDHREIRILDLEGARQRTIDLGLVSHGVLDRVQGASEHLAGIGISPNGGNLIINLLIFHDIYAQGGESRESYLVDLEEGTSESIFLDEPVTGVSWSPDGARIAYIHVEVLHDGDLVILKLDDECVFVAPFPPEIRSPSWSKDASRLAFIYRGLIHIWEIDANIQEGVLEGCP
jgi:Tol biopolymer transport system component